MSEMLHTQQFSSARNCISFDGNCAPTQGELEGSARYSELTKSAENFFKQSVVSKSR